MNNTLKYYKEISEKTEISSEFAKQFGKDPFTISKNVRKIIVHPEDLKGRVSDSNWPKFNSAKEIEGEAKKQKFVCGICADFSMLTVAVLRFNKIPARVRCGFASYFSKSGYEDHWVVEWWDKKVEKWKMLDAQTQKNNLKVGEFMNGAVAWKLYRQFNFDPTLFGYTGIMDGAGLYYIVGNMIRDLSGLMKDKLLYSQELAFMEKGHKLTKKEIEFLDEVSDVIIKEDLKELEIYWLKIKKMFKDMKK